MCNYGVKEGYMILKILSCGGAMSNSYVICDDQKKHAVLIDPSVPPMRYFWGMPDFPWPEKILITHAHYDHIYYIYEWYKKGIPIYISEIEAPFLMDPVMNLSSKWGERFVFDGVVQHLHDGDTIPFGDDHFEVYVTPGHTPGSCTYRIGEWVFPGDLFAVNGRAGSCKNLGSDRDTMIRSTHRVFSLGSELMAYPGHGSPGAMCIERIFRRLYIQEGGVCRELTYDN